MHHTTAAKMVAWTLAMCLSSVAVAQNTGVSSERVSLPEGPGSLEGIGENVDINPNMGQMSYSVPIELPSGYAQATPSLALNYSSGAGSSVVGMGWSMSLPFIERMTSKGLPEYDEDDMFAADGGNQLVRISQNPSVYRARFEGAFVRYTWHENTNGVAGYWTAEYPDGRVAYFGADANGNSVANARFEGASGTFRYLITEAVSPWGHKIRYNYSDLGNTPQVSTIAYGFRAQEPLFEVAFVYESRQDAISDGVSGVNEVLEHRLTEVGVFVEGRAIRTYDLVYDSYADSGGASRLMRVERYGAEGGVHPIAFRFTYNRALGEVCDDETCQRPFVTNMGSIGLDIQAGDATLIDINGDALPDVLDTSQSTHYFLINQLQSDGTQAFSAPIESALGLQGSHRLRSGSVQVLDVNGDGFTDMLNTTTGAFLQNTGEGDWTDSFNLFSGDDALPSLDGDLDPSDGELRTIRFVDYDNDKRIDALRSQGSGDLNTTAIFRNDPIAGFIADPNVMLIGAGFESDRMELADMNGDGLLDPVQLNANQLRYRLNLGWGQWSDWVVIDNIPMTETEIPNAEITDINGDGLDDIVVVQADQVRYALNRSAQAFDAPVVLSSADILGNNLPERDSSTTVLYADMNGNGSTDVVWLTSNGDVNYLELFPVRPNLLARVENSIGMVTDVSYSPSVNHAARAQEEGMPWEHKLPYPMLVVDYIDVWNSLTDLHEVTHFSYRDGFYDGVEKQFRGYAHVVGESPGGETHEMGRETMMFEVGIEDTYRNGLLVYQRNESNNRVIKEKRIFYDECELGGIPDDAQLEFDVVWICNTADEEIVQEGRPADEWLTIRREFTHDPWGNLATSYQKGVVAVGIDGNGCEACEAGAPLGTPCGQTCEGDESYTSKSYISLENTNGRWILSALLRERTGSSPEDPNYAEQIAYYDGFPFEGMPYGQLTHGNLTRMTERLNTDDDPIETFQIGRDDFGNVLERRLPNAPGDERNSHRVLYGYDEDGLLMTSIDVLFENEGEAPYRLRQEVGFDPLWRKANVVTGWMVTRNGQLLSAPNAQRMEYDEFGRQISSLRPGDDEASTRWRYNYSSPVTQIIEQSQTVEGGEFDQETVRCFDGLGRLVQTRTKLANGRYQVSGFRVFNKQGNDARTYASFTDPSADCDMEPPNFNTYTAYHYDAVRRLIQTSTITPSQTFTSEIAHYPLQTLEYDANDTDADSDFAQTPKISQLNGLGQLTRTTHMLSQTESLVYSYGYDNLGNLSHIFDPEGNIKRQVYDLKSRLIEVDDPDRGHIAYSYDANGNITGQTTGDGATVRFEYDAFDREIRQWDPANPADTAIVSRYDFPRDCPEELCTNAEGKRVETIYPILDGEFGRDWIGYDARERMTTRRRTVGNASFDFGFVYDHADRMVQKIYPTGDVVDFNTDNAGRLTDVPGYINALSYDDNGQVHEAKLANGATTTYQYDSKMLMQSVKTEHTNGKVLMNHRYTLDNVGNIIEISDDRPQLNQPSATVRYNYDALYRLTSAHLDPDQADYDETMMYQYNALDNMVSKASSINSRAHVGTMTYGQGAGPHAVTTAGDVTLDYDESGQMTRRGDMSFAWNHLGQLVGAQRGGTVLSQNSYDHNGNRVVQHDEDSLAWLLTPDFEIRDGIASLYIQMNDNRVARVQSSELAVAMFSDIAPRSEGVPSPNGVINAADAWVAHQHTTAQLQLPEGTQVSPPAKLLQATLARMLLQHEGYTQFYHNDIKGTPVSITDADGNVIDQITYYPYGQRRSSLQTHATDPYGWNSKEHNATTGLTDYGNRSYDPWLGRWLSPDAQFDSVEPRIILRRAEEFGAYVFALNNPATYSDDDGNFVFEAIGAVGGALLFGGGWAQNAWLDAKSAGASSGEALKSAALWGVGGVLRGAASGAMQPATTILSGSLTVVAEIFAKDASAHLKVRSGAQDNTRLLTSRLVYRTASIAIGLGVAIAITGGTVAIAIAAAGAVWSAVRAIDAIQEFRGKTTLSGSLGKLIKTTKLGRKLAGTGAGQKLKAQFVTPNYGNTAKTTTEPGSGNQSRKNSAAKKSAKKSAKNAANQKPAANPKVSKK